MHVFEPDASYEIDTGQVRLHVLEWGRDRSQALLIVHGMRDHAIGFDAVAAPIAAQGWRVIAFDLRGHGDSDAPGIYTLPHFSVDLAAVIERLELSAPVLLGHSLGGQIAFHYAGLHPGTLGAIVNVEGLGPPPRPGWGTLEGEREQARRSFESARDLSARQRPLPDLAFATGRLLANNPRLDPERAAQLARLGTREVDGGLVWKFDPRVQNVWASVHHEANPAIWSAIDCPVLVVLGALAAEYWTRRMPAGGNWNGRWDEQSLAERTAPLANKRIVHIEDAGHMVHYDSPDKLVMLVLDFLNEL